MNSNSFQRRRRRRSYRHYGGVPDNQTNNLGQQQNVGAQNMNVQQNNSAQQSMGFDLPAQSNNMVGAPNQTTMMSPPQNNMPPPQNNMPVQQNPPQPEASKSWFSSPLSWFSGGSRRRNGRKYSLRREGGRSRRRRGGCGLNGGSRRRRFRGGNKAVDGIKTVGSSFVSVNNVAYRGITGKQPQAKANRW